MQKWSNLPRRSALSALAAAALCLSRAPEARAQRWMTDAVVGVGTGLEGASVSGSGMGWQRARLRLTAGFDLAIDESVYQAWGVRAFAELERSASVGAELRYVRWVSRSIALHAGLTGVLAPETLLGGQLGATWLLPLSRKVDLFLEPTFAALPLGSDLRGSSVLLWVLLSGGVRVDL